MVPFLGSHSNFSCASFISWPTTEFSLLGHILWIFSLPSDVDPRV